MVTAELFTDGRIYLNAEYRQKERIKTIPGAMWEDKVKMWGLPLSWAACVQMRAVLGVDLHIGPALNAWAGAEIQNRINPCLNLRVAQDSDPIPGFEHLFPFQRAGVRFLATAGQALLGDDMGLGKTAQLIAVLETLENPFPALIVAPNGVKSTWAKEYAKWAPERRVVVIGGTPTQRRKQIQMVKDGEADVAIFNWEGLRGHTRIAGYPGTHLTDSEKQEKELNEIPWVTVAADEAHRGKDPHSKQTRALWWLGRGTRYRYALTGTPVADSPMDLWSLMHFVSPDEYPRRTAFTERYALKDWSVFGFMEVTGIKPETSPELFKILDPRFIRRLKSAVLPDLPPKVYTTVEVTMGGPQKKAYDQMKEHMLAQLEGGILMAGNPLTQMGRLIQFASASGKIEMEGEVEKLVLSEPSCKVDALEEVIADIGHQQALIFAESVQLVNIAAQRLANKGYKVGLITGAVEGAARDANVDAFQRGELQHLCITLGAGGEGLTLTAATVEVFLQRSFSAVKNAQAEDRAYGRLSDAHGVTVIDIITTDSIESRVHEVRQEKAEMAEEIVRDAETLQSWLSDGKKKRKAKVAAE